MMERPHSNTGGGMTPVATQFAPRTRDVRSQGYLLEPLEHRRVLSAATLTDGVLLITGTEGQDRISIQRDGGGRYINIQNQYDPTPEGYMKGMLGQRFFLRD